MMMKKQNNWILSGARVIDPVNNIDDVRNVYIKDGIIVDEAAMQGVEAEELDLTGKVVAPGFIDVHVHLRQPGKVDAETVRTGTLAAAAGGFTTVVAMPNTSPVTDNAAQVQYIRELAERDGIVHVLPCGALSKGLAGEEMAPIGSLASAGVAALSDDGKCVQNHELIECAISTAKRCGLKVAIDLASFNVVEENIDFLRRIVSEYVDIVFANEDEARVFSAESEPINALQYISEMCELAVVKIGMRGALIKQGEHVVHVGIMEAAKRVDTTGAGDFYAAGFLYGLTLGLDLRQCGTIGAVTAGKVIEIVGTTLSDEAWDDIFKYVNRVKTERYLF